MQDKEESKEEGNDDDVNETIEVRGEGEANRENGQSGRIGENERRPTNRDGGIHVRVPAERRCGAPLGEVTDLYPTDGEVVNVVYDVL